MTKYFRACGKNAPRCSSPVPAAAGLYGEFWQRSDVLNAEPDFGSLTLGSLNFPKQASINDPQMVQQLAAAMKQRGIIPEMEIFDLGMVDYAHFLIRKGFIDPSVLRQYPAGFLGNAQCYRRQPLYCRACPASGNHLGGDGHRPLPIPYQLVGGHHGRPRPRRT